MRIVILAVGCAMFAGTASAQAPVSQVRLGTALKFDIDARVDADSRMATPSIGIESADFTVGSPRIGVEGALFKKIEFEISRDVGTGGQWRDVMVNLRPTKAFEVEIGQFKMPFGRETLTGRKNLDFINRSLIATQLVLLVGGTAQHGFGDAEQFGEIALRSAGAIERHVKGLTVWI